MDIKRELEDAEEQLKENRLKVAGLQAQIQTLQMDLNQAAGEQLRLEGEVRRLKKMQENESK